eukprot:TRINITY_DN1643_c0_g2_i1.p1 TRINITY_DN1643_c0_g2~~TRINITY_DN1643_c0_g2_i1.p1  ORF type:complete len:235 (+),score=31.12 TRINITY_DN1643_c0_g2_i1:1085-1789(+)
MRLLSSLAALVLTALTLTHGFEHARILYPEADVTLNSNKFGASAAATTSGQELETYSDWYEVYMRFTLESLHNWESSSVTRATVRLYTTRSDGPIHIYVQHLNDTSWATGSSLAWNTRPRYGPIISSFKSYTRMSNVIDVTEQIQAVMALPLQGSKMFAIRLFQEGQTMVPFGGAGTWQRFASLEHDDYHTRPYLEVETNCVDCVGVDTDYNDDTHEGVDSAPGSGTPLDAAPY